MHATIKTWGNSQGIRLPKNLLESANFSNNDKVELIALKDKIIIQKSQKRKGIKELFENYNGDYCAAEFDWGKPVGKEIW